MKILFLAQSPARPDESSRRESLAEQLQGYASPGTTIEYCNPNDFPGAAVFEELGRQKNLTGLHHYIQVPTLVHKAVWAEENGYDAVIQSNTFDPGVEASRLAVRIPVIGLFRTSLHVAATLGARIGIMVPLVGHVPHVRTIVQSYGMTSFVCRIDYLGEYGAVSALRSRHDELLDGAAEVVARLVDGAGAEVVIPLGGALIPEVIDPAELEERAGVPVLNTKQVGIRFAELCVQLGLRHSPAGYPPAALAADMYQSYAFSPAGSPAPEDD